MTRHPFRLNKTLRLAALAAALCASALVHADEYGERVRTKIEACLDGARCMIVESA